MNEYLMPIKKKYRVGGKFAKHTYPDQTAAPATVQLRLPSTGRGLNTVVGLQIESHPDVNFSGVQ